MDRKRLVVGMSGASGTSLAVRTLRVLRATPDVETHLVATRGAIVTAGYESECPFDEIASLADAFYGDDALDAPIASGSFQTAGMLVVPCSMKSAAGIANGFSGNLLLRAADVCVKERRPLVLAARETPLSPIHLGNLQALASLPQVWVMPPMMTWYTKPQTIGDMEQVLVARMLAPFGIEVPTARWGD